MGLIFTTSYNSYYPTSCCVCAIFYEIIICYEKGDNHFMLSSSKIGVVVSGVIHGEACEWSTLLLKRHITVEFVHHKIGTWNHVFCNLSKAHMSTKHILLCGNLFKLFFVLDSTEFDMQSVAVMQISSGTSVVSHLCVFYCYSTMICEWWAVVRSEVLHLCDIINVHLLSVCHQFLFYSFWWNKLTCGPVCFLLFLLMLNLLASFIFHIYTTSESGVSKCQTMCKSTSEITVEKRQKV